VPLSIFLFEAKILKCYLLASYPGLPVISIFHVKMGRPGYEATTSVIVNFLLSPPGAREGPLRMLLFDSWYDHYRGVICLVAVTDGSVRVGE
jgi:translation elongation factor EF-4